MKFKALGAFAGLALLAACSSSPTTSANNSNLTGAESSGPGGDESGLKSVGDRVFFAFNKADLDSTATGTLSAQAAWMAKYPSVNVLVAGNCDERGTETYNLALGQKRADAARDDLVADGVASSRISTVSYGKDKPIATGHDEASWQQNRNAITSVVGFNPQGN